MLCLSFFRIVMLVLHCSTQVGTQFCRRGQRSDLCRATYPILCAESQHVGRGDVELSCDYIRVILLLAIPAVRPIALARFHLKRPLMDIYRWTTAVRVVSIPR